MEFWIKSYKSPMDADGDAEFSTITVKRQGCNKKASRCLTVTIDHELKSFKTENAIVLAASFHEVKS